jgi:hypothetical protein
MLPVFVISFMPNFSLLTGVSGREPAVAWSAKLGGKVAVAAVAQPPPTNQACDISAVIDINHTSAPVVPPPTHHNSINSSGMDTSSDSSRNIFEENICSKDDISDMSSCLASSSLRQAEEEEEEVNCDVVEAKTYIHNINNNNSASSGVLFDTKSCLTGENPDQNANFLTEVKIFCKCTVRLLR